MSPSSGHLVTRFAPSPTGRLHLGHAYAALFAARKARESGGRFLLRIEDIDATRCREEFIAGIYEDLTWLSLTWEHPVRRQSEYFADYRTALDRLRARNFLYPCFCSRKEIQTEVAAAGHAPHQHMLGPEGTVYPGTCRNLSAAERDARMTSEGQYCWRLDIARAAASVGELVWHDHDQGRIVARPTDYGDVVLARKDTPTSYHLAVTVDDALQGVTCVTRGMDLFRATDIHRLLQALLNLPVPAYHHHKLLTDPQGKRYAKRDQAVTLQALREQGKRSQEVTAMTGIALSP
ncbi:MAG: tRNA glutamyl-Q(34) synthetase GluQRS [Alphaproteobacteria bacterium]